jgi:hypothetical protein
VCNYSVFVMWRTGLLPKLQSKGSGMDQNDQFGAFLEASNRPFWATLVDKWKSIPISFLVMSSHQLV